MAPSPTLPGRLGDPDMTLGEDPRADPRMVAILSQLGLTGPGEPTPVTADTPLDALLEYCTEAESQYDMLFSLLAQELPPIDNVDTTTRVISGIDGNDITLFIHRPTDTHGAVPAVLHLHGGGMVILEAAAESPGRWRSELASTGLVVVGVEFRNGGGKHGPHPFPAGLNDCTSALRWLHANGDEMGVSKVIVSGESGGGNLSLATTLKAKQDGNLDQIAGVYAQCPYISNAYAEKLPELPSLYENDGYFLDCENMGALARVYDPDQVHTRNPLAWPYYASTADLEGLPPHVISVNELDPLRDEGLAYFRKLLGAGVPAVSRTVNGTCHAGDCVFRAAMPDVYLSTVRDIKSFADSL